jgi:hypothetical protein
MISVPALCGCAAVGRDGGVAQATKAGYATDLKMLTSWRKLGQITWQAKRLRIIQTCR